MRLVVLQHPNQRRPELPALKIPAVQLAFSPRMLGLTARLPVVCPVVTPLRSFTSPRLRCDSRDPVPSRRGIAPPNDRNRRTTPCWPSGSTLRSRTIGAVAGLEGAKVFRPRSTSSGDLGRNACSAPASAPRHLSGLPPHPHGTARSSPAARELRKTHSTTRDCLGNTDNAGQTRFRSVNGAIAGGSDPDLARKAAAWTRRATN